MVHEGFLVIKVTAFLSLEPTSYFFIWCCFLMPSTQKWSHLLYFYMYQSSKPTSIQQCYVVCCVLVCLIYVTFTIWKTWVGKRDRIEWNVVKTIQLIFVIFLNSTVTITLLFSSCKPHKSFGIQYPWRWKCPDTSYQSRSNWQI